jgi:hypothetical protein
MSIHISISPEGAADRLALWELVDAYVLCADRGNAKGQMALFTEDTCFVVYMDAKSEIPSQKFRGRNALAPVLMRIRFRNAEGGRVLTEFIDNGHGLPDNASDKNTRRIRIDQTKRDGHWTRHFTLHRRSSRRGALGCK